jgi:carbon starvation protein
VLYVGYGSMLVEGFLAVLVIICVTAGISIALQTDTGNILTGSAAWSYQYSGYLEQEGLSGKLAPVVMGAANMMASLGLPLELSAALMGVFIASFAGTTLDTSVRLQRYAISELAETMKIPKLGNRGTATSVAVITAAILAFATGAAGTGAMLLWPLFGSANQLLAALTLLVLTVYLKGKGGLKYLCTLLPCIFMLITTIWALAINEIEFYRSQNYLLTVMGAVNLLLAIWMTIETVLVLCKTGKAACRQ